MKKIAILILLLMLVIPVLPVALADDSTTNVDIEIGADTVNLDVTCTTSTGGIMDIRVNGVDVRRQYVTKVYEHNYDNEILFLTQQIGGTQFSVVALANYTSGKVSMLLVNDCTLAKWMGVNHITTPIGQRIFEGNSSIVVELDRLDTQLTNGNAELTDMITRLTIVIGQIDSRLATETYERRKAEEEVRGLVEKLQSESATKRDLEEVRGLVEKLQSESATKRDLEAVNRNLVFTTSELTDTKAQLELMRLVLMAVVAVAVGLAIAWLAIKRNRG